MSKKQKLDKSEANHTVQILNSEDLLNSEEAKDASKGLEKHHIAKSSLIQFLLWTSLNKKRFVVQIVDGITQNALRNLIYLNSEKIFVFEATETRINFLSSAKLTKSIREFIGTGISSIKISWNNGVIFINSRFTITIDKRTGEISSQREISANNIPFIGYNYKYSYLRISEPKKNRASIFKISHKNVRGSNYSGIKGRVYNVSRKRISHVLELPFIETYYSKGQYHKPGHDLMEVYDTTRASENKLWLPRVTPNFL